MINNSANLFYGLRISFDEMHALVGSQDQQQFNYRLVNCLLWITSCQERIPSLVPSDEFFSGIRCAFNCMKHNSSLVRLQEHNGFRLPTAIPSALGGTYIWASLDHASEKIQNKLQLSSYKEYLEGKPIDATLREAKDRIIEAYEKDNIKSPPQA